MELQEAAKIQAQAFLDTIGGQAIKIVNSAVRKANKLMAKTGYCITVQVDFRELPKAEEKQELSKES